MENPAFKPEEQQVGDTPPPTPTKEPLKEDGDDGLKEDLSSSTRKKSILKKQPPGGTQEINLSPILHLLGDNNSTPSSFYLTTKYFACCPNFTILPIQQISISSSPSGPPSPPQESFIICKPLRLFNFLCCCLGSPNAQRVTVQRGGGGHQGDEILTFQYYPHIWCPAESKGERVLDIYLPQKNEKLGWICGARDVGKGSEIHCPLTKEKFVTRGVEDKNFIRSFKIENSVGIEVASGRITSSSWFGHIWSGYHFNFVPSEMDTLSHATRAVLLITFLYWVIDAREKKQWGYIWSGLFILMGLVCWGLILLYGPGPTSAE